MRRFVTRWSGEVVCLTDMLLALAVVLLAMFVLAAPPRPKAATARQDGTPLGALTVQAFWPDDLNVDVDLWLLVPGEPRAVGYSNKNGMVVDLLRDDLGFVNDPSGRNFEIAATRGLPEGEYVVNLHLYSNGYGAALPIPVHVIVQSRRPREPATTLVDREVPLDRVGQEVTVMRFRLDARGELVPGSVNALPRKLRDAL